MPNTLDLSSQNMIFILIMFQSRISISLDLRIHKLVQTDFIPSTFWCSNEQIESACQVSKVEAGHDETAYLQRDVALTARGLDL